MTNPTTKLKNEIKKLRAEIEMLRLERPKRVIIPDIDFDDLCKRQAEFVDRMLDPSLTPDMRDLCVLAFNLGMAEDCFCHHENKNGDTIGYIVESQ